MKLNLAMTIPNGVLSSTSAVWEILVAAKNGDAVKLRESVTTCPELIYAQYNYTPPIHFAVREGHTELVRYLLDHGAYDINYKTYPFLDTLPTLAADSGLFQIAEMLEQYSKDPGRQQYKGDNGEIHYNRSEAQKQFEEAVSKGNYEKTAEILRDHPQFAKDETYFWSEGIMTMPAKACNWKLLELLMNYGARVPSVLKWCQYYYFENYQAAALLMEKGMNPNTRSWQEVTLLHDMAQKGDIPKAELLLKYGANINPVDDEYGSTPLGLAARWGHVEMVDLLLKRRADPNKSVASWSTPLAWARNKGWKEIETMLLKSGAMDDVISYQ